MKQDEDILKGRQSPTGKEETVIGRTTETENIRDETNGNNINNEVREEKRTTKEHGEHTRQHRKENHEEEPKTTTQRIESNTDRTNVDPSPKDSQTFKAARPANNKDREEGP